MSAVALEFVGELAEFLPRPYSNAPFSFDPGKKRSVKDLIESLGVPHTEAAYIVIDGAAAGFDALVCGGERIAVYPRTAPPEPEERRYLQPPLPRPPRFLCDVHLGKLARRLRFLGLDTAYETHADDAELAAEAERDQRMLLTSDRRLLMRKQVTAGYFVRGNDPDAQVERLVRDLDIASDCRPFGRCPNCNGMLEEIHATDAAFAEIRPRIPPRVLTWRTDYRRCQSCGQLYWEGTHYPKLQTMVRRYLG